MKQSQNQSGFGIVEITVIIVIIALLGVGGWYVWHAQQSADKQQPANTSSSQQSNVDPYAGWQTYCDNADKVCFKYPSDWIASEEGAASTGVSIQNPLGTLAISYLSEDARDGREMSIYVAQVGDLATTNPKYKSLGYFVPSTTNSLPSYSVIDSDSLATFPLTAGAQSTFPVNPRFTISSGRHGSLAVKPIGQVFNDDQAKAWFESDEAKISLTITDSFYLQ